MKKAFFYTLVTVFLVACSNGNEANEESNDTASEDASSGGDLVVSIPSDAVSMDTHGSNDTQSSWIRGVIHERLVEQDENHDIVGKLASEWERVDEHTWEFKLRENISFHDGSEFNSEVVKVNLERVNDLAVASPRKFLVEMIEEIIIVDDYTVQVITEYPYSPLLNNLTHDVGGMMSKDLIYEDYENALTEASIDMTVEEYFELRAEGGSEYEEVASDITSYIGAIIERGPVGTGYMQFESRSAGENTVVVRYDDYWGDNALIDSINFKVVSETGSRIAELETGSSHFIVDIQPSNLERIEQNEDVTLARNNAISIDYVGFNTSKEPFDNKLVRKALTHAFDKQAVISGVFDDVGTEAVAPLSPGILGYSDELESVEFDMDKAKELLAEAGYEDGFSANIMVNEANPQTADMAVFFQEALSELGINISIDQVEWGTMLEATGNGEPDMFIMSWNNTPGDPESGLTLFNSRNIGGSGNRTQFQNDELDKLLEDGAKEEDLDTRQKIYEEAQKILVDEAPAIFVRHGEHLNAYSNSVENIKINSYNSFDFSETRFVD